MSLMQSNMYLARGLFQTLGIIRLTDRVGAGEMTNVSLQKRRDTSGQADGEVEGS